MIDFDFIDWDAPDDPRGNTRHILDAGVSVEEVEEVLLDPRGEPLVSRSTGRPAVRGTTLGGRRLFVVFELDRAGGVTVLRPVTAYDVED